MIHSEYKSTITPFSQLLNTYDEWMEMPKTLWRLEDELNDVLLKANESFIILLNEGQETKKVDETVYCITFR
ncbi:hypothetical protein TNCV_4117761 [Trichonephila clavipes]|nr:hypothetical protein TNCV_4117761 [Trichonephila clavipes]